MGMTQKSANISNVSGLVRTGSIVSKVTKKGEAGILIEKPTPVLLSRNGLPVLPVKKVSPEVLAEMKDREERAKIKEVPKNMAEERLKIKEENDRRVLKEDYRRKQMIMKEIQKPKDEIEQALFNDMKDFIKKHGRRQFFKYYLSTQAGAATNDATKFIQKRPLIDNLKFGNMYDLSLAEKKRIWIGEEGRFKKSEVQEWFKVWDETRLYHNRGQVVDNSKKTVLNN